MPIYTSNRSKGFNIDQIAANESYKWNDIGRILCESQANDMAFFEAALACDFTEVKGLHEGAILEAEVSELKKANKEKLINRLIERLKAFWAKLKGAIASAINWLAEKKLDNEKFIKYFDSKIEYEMIKKWDGSIPNVVTYDLRHKSILLNLDRQIHFITSSGIKSVNEILADNIGSDASDVTPSNYTAKALEACKKIETLNSDNIIDFKIDISRAEDHIKFLQRTQKEAEAEVKESIDNIKKTKADNENVDSLIEFVSAKEIIITTIAKAAIIATKEDLKSRRVALRAAMNDILKSNNDLHEATILNDIDEFDGILNIGLA